MNLITSIRKSDIFFFLICMFILKLILLPAFYADACVLAVLLAYRPISKYIDLRKKVIVSQELEEKFQKVDKDITDLSEVVKSFKTKEQIVQQFGIGKK